MNQPNPTVQLACPSLADLPQIAQAIRRFAGAQRVWLLTGTLGAGKTTLVQALCQELGVVDSVLSPTFSLVNEYRTAGGEPIYHFDFYRLQQVGEAVDMGAEEYFYSGAYCLIEWPERVAQLWPDQYLKIDIAVGQHNQRLITLKNYD
jgi:tRNA threonylcarbamoyladenosine biosynthesis protein TsaE